MHKNLRAPKWHAAIRICIRKFQCSTYTTSQTRASRLGRFTKMAHPPNRHKHQKFAFRMEHVSNNHRTPKTCNHHFGHFVKDILQTKLVLTTPLLPRHRAQRQHFGPGWRGKGEGKRKEGSREKKTTPTRLMTPKGGRRISLQVRMQV